MIFTVISLLILVPGLITWFRGKPGSDTECAGMFLTSLAIFTFLIAVLLPTTVAWVHENSNEASIEQFSSNETIYNNKANDITSQLTALLAVDYPKLEEEVLGTLAKNPDLLFVQFPQLRSSETITTLANQIKNLRSQVYQQELNKTRMEKDIRTRQRNPFFLQILVPNHN
jgi:sensor histidine kinase YesM